jgi:putative transposase
MRPVPVCARPARWSASAVRTLQRWKANGRPAVGDRRPLAERPMPAHALTEEERARILAVANEPRFADQPPARIVPALADEGVYIASESSFQRVLRAHGQNASPGPQPGAAAARGRRPHTSPRRPARSGAGT